MKTARFAAGALWAGRLNTEALTTTEKLWVDSRTGNLNIDWSGFDGGGYPYFGIGANHLCNNVPECIENCANFELTLDQFYYSIPLEAPQDCP